MRQLHRRRMMLKLFFVPLLISRNSAESALSRTDEVDIKGGWKEGQPYVIPNVLGLNYIKAISSASHMQHSPKLSP